MISSLVKAVGLNESQERLGDTTANQIVLLWNKLPQASSYALMFADIYTMVNSLQLFLCTSDIDCTSVLHR